jgi:UDPglucose--hexose-1-phosphate uridylyltransferase
LWASALTVPVVADDTGLVQEAMGGIHEPRIEFLKRVETSEFLCPPSFERDIHRVEYREDPLTRVPCRINVRRAERPKQTSSEQSEDLPLDSNSCPFCVENIEALTPRFPSDFFPDGRIKRGESVLFPNLFPLAERHVTAVLTRRHFVGIDRFTEHQLADSLHLAQEYLRRMCLHETTPWYPIYVWNHLPPSAASIIHPHVQILADRQPTPYQKRLIEASEAYLTTTGRNYWQDLLDEERERGERLITEGASLAAVASYAPQGNREVTIIFRRAEGLLDLLPAELVETATCLARLLQGYSEMGVNSFNLSTFSAPLGLAQPCYRLHAKLIARPVFRPYYRNDTGILERFHYDADIEVAPELFAREMRSYIETN